MSDRPRPPNAAGPNGLRGGIKTYAPKTITGPWLEELGGSAGYKRGFTTVDYETEAQHQQIGATLSKSVDFGAGLPDQDQLDRPESPFKSPTVRGHGNENTWTTNARLMSTALLTQSKDYEIPTSLKPRMAPEKLEEYRRNWTIESDVMRDIRFTTETRIAGSAVGGGKFTTNTVRSLPGTPKPYETYRENMIRTYGLFAFTVVKFHFIVDHPSDSMTSSEFRAAILKSGGELKLYEMNQVIAFTSPTSSIPVQKFVDILKGHVIGFPRHWVEDFYRKLLQSPSLGSGRKLTTQDLVHCVNSHTFPEITEALKKYGEKVYSNDGQWSLEAFVQLQHDMFASNPILYGESMKDIWIIK